MGNEFYALVTGASRGIGRAIADELASRGHNLALHSLPDEDLRNYGSELSNKYGIKVATYEIDLTDKDGPQLLYNEIETDGLQVNILINNAGIGIEGPLDTYSREIIDNIILLNIRALTLLTFLFTPDLKRSASYILNVSSLGCYIPTPYKSVYAASKSYIYYFTRSLESEFRGTTVKTSVLVPGAVKTNNHVLRRIEKAGWFGRVTAIEPEEVAAISIDAMFKGRKVIMPGRLTRLVFQFGLVIPEGIIMAVTRNVFRAESSV